MPGSFDFRVSRREGTEYAFFLPHPATNKARPAKAANKARLVTKSLFFMEGCLFLPTAERGNRHPGKGYREDGPIIYPPVAAMPAKKDTKRHRPGTWTDGATPSAVGGTA